MSARRTVVAIGLLAALIAVACLRAESKIVLHPAVLHPQTGCAYAIELSEGSPCLIPYSESRIPHLTAPPRSPRGRGEDADLGSFDLPLDAGGEYALIVASLGDASQTFHVELEARRRPSVDLFPAVVVAPLSVRADIPRGAEESVHHPPPGPPLRRGGRYFRGPSVVESHPHLPLAGASRWSSPGHPTPPHSTFDAQRSTFEVSSIATIRDSSSETVSRNSKPQPAARRFFLHVSASPLEDASGYVPIMARPAGEGHLVRIFVDAAVDVEDLAPGLVAETIRLLDDEIIPRSRELLGEHADVDGDGKLAVLLTPWLGKLRGGQTSLNGCVRANDFQAGIEAPFSNSADLVYLNSHLACGPALKTLLSHEYTHAVCFSRRFAGAGGALPVEDDWLNEAIAHVAENLHETGWSNLAERIESFLAAPHTAPLVVPDYYRAGLWRDPACRGATFLFLRFCVDQFGEQLLGELAGSPLTGPRNLEQATRVPFAELFRHWTIALASDGIASLPLSSKLGDRQLHGVRRVDWEVDRDSCAVDLRGTSLSLVRLSTASPGPVRITLRSAPAALLQVTLTRK